MKVIEIREEFGLDRLVPAERPVPEALPGTVVVRIRAVSLNFRDLLMVQGRYDPRQPLPLVPCSDGAGVVESVGDGVTRFRPGDRVAPIFAQQWISGHPTPARLRSTLGGPLDGTLGQYGRFDEEGLVPIPSHLNDEQAATLACAGVTAWNAVIGTTELKPGATVLVQGTGGVAVFALQFARLAGARAVVLSKSDEKLERARRLGAWQTINYLETPGWGKEVRRRTEGGVDLVIEVGGAATLAQSLDALAFGGQISLIGNLGGNRLEVDLVRLFMRRIRLQGILVGDRETFETMNRAIEAGGLEPCVDRTFGFDDYRAAFEALPAGDHFGKICIRIDA